MPAFDTYQTNVYQVLIDILRNHAYCVLSSRTFMQYEKAGRL
ncbi:hypothetical protein Z948_1146 [Sulfitobacter donghicola DSW-25 = KCTC 12864 = JCM 14565]|nr:hypothetical protein Z948_1146 [Sulfitobacter donghicola DSW-25 = KCTC 12864 = JCM 14565]